MYDVRTAAPGSRAYVTSLSPALALLVDVLVGTGEFSDQMGARWEVDADIVG